MTKNIETVEDLVQDTLNANKHTQRGRDMLKRSLEEYGAGRSVLADKNGQVIAGNLTVQIATKLGIPVRVVETIGDELVVVKRNDLDLENDIAARELGLADNRIAEASLNWDGEHLLQMAQEGVGLDQFWDEDELNNILDGLEYDDDFEDDDAEPELSRADELQQHWGTALGQVWLLPSRDGSQVHKLACGDATDKNVVSTLLQAALIDALWTDPPYGVSYVGKTADALTIQNDDLKPEALLDLLKMSLGLAFEHCKEGGSWYVASPTGPLFYEFATVLKDIGVWRQTLIWKKNQFVLGRSDYQHQHEAIFYGWKPGAAHYFVDERTHNTVLEFDKPLANHDHPTMKPVDLIQYCIRNSSRRGQVVYDPFSGSGSTLIACENESRTCRALELDPKYVAVALQRYQDAFGITAKLEHDPEI